MDRFSGFQDAFSDALRGNLGAIEPWVCPRHPDTPGMAVYRNTITRGSIDVLASTFSTVVTMVGEDWFRAAAAVYVGAHPPTTPSLLRYGADFPAWLSAFEPARDTPYLPAIARLDRLWWDAYFAADADALDPQALSVLSAEDLENTGLRLHPSVRIAEFDHNLASLWQAHRQDAPSREFGIAEGTECILIARSGLEVEGTIITPASHAFLAACRVGASVMTAADRAVATDPTASLPDLIRPLLVAGVFTHLAAARPGSEHDD